MIVLFGLKTCDSCRRARRWLDDLGLVHRFVDFREQGLDGDTLDRWIDVTGIDSLVNRRGRTWRSIPKELRDRLDADGVRALLLEQPALIKRPLWDLGGRILVGFDETVRSIIGGYAEVDA